MLRNIIFLTLFLGFINGRGQTFRDIQAGLTGVSESASNWIDYDEDGDLDVMVTGEFYKGNTHYIRTKFYRNDRNDRFKEVYSPVVNVYRGDFDWADYDLDGDPDLFITGQDPSGKYVAKLYRNNNRTIQLSPVYTGIPGMVDGSVEWGDFDHDGDPDLLLTGATRHGNISAIYRNDRRNKFTRIETHFPNLDFGTGKFADIDNDGDLDVILSGAEASGNVVTRIFLNDSSHFVPLNFGFIPLKLSDIAWGDYDNDGDVDFVINGEDNNGRFHTKLYQNVENRDFILMFPNFADVRSGSVDWGDFDRDGDLDLLLTGESYNGPVSIIYRNDRSNQFTDIHAQLIGLYMSDGHFGDYDNDGDLDVIISGMSNNYRFISRIYRNDPVKKHKSTKKEQTENIWNSKYYNYERSKRIYYYVYSSGYFDMDGDGTKEFNAFVSTIKKPAYKYELEQKFNAYIHKHYPQWPKIDQANIVQNGFVKYDEAVKSRETIIKEYQGKGFHVYTVDW
jgi:hypothetical protein